MRYIRITAVLLLSACGDGGTAPTTPTTTPTPPTPVATSISLSATTLSFSSLGEQQQLSATVKDQNGATMASATVTWASSDIAVATVSAGLVTSVGSGSTTITATSGSASATGTVAVTLATDGLWNAIAAGYLHTCGLTTTGDGYCWGYNYSGQLGNGSTAIFGSTVPVQVSGGHTWTSINPGADHTCGVTTEGSGYCWGGNELGQLGNGLMTTSAVPVEVSGGHAWIRITGGGGATCGVTTEGTGYCWGYNEGGQLGNGSDSTSTVPVEVSGGHVWSSITAGISNTCGVTTEGSGYCWGTTFFGQLGNGLTTDISHTPAEISDGHTWTSINPGEGHTCGITTEGTGYCWGANFASQLGDPLSADISAVPVEVTGGHAWSSITAGGSATCGMTTEGNGYCWGDNSIGQLGNPVTTDITAIPVEVSGGHAWSSITAASGYHTCGVTTEGSGYCWGLNDGGQIGDGTMTTVRITPVKVTTPWTP